MVIPAPDDKPLEVRGADGQVIAYIVSTEQMSRLHAESDSLREQVATLQRLRDRYVSELAEVLKTYIPIPPTEEDLKAAVPNSDELDRLIADLKSR